MRQTAEIYTDPNFEAVSKAAYGLTGLPELYPGANFAGVTPQLSFGGVPSAAAVAFDARFPIHAGDRRVVLSDTVSFSTASHLVKAGFLYERDYNSEGLNGPCYSGCFGFGRDTLNPGDTNYAYANALLGNFQSYSQSNTRVFRGARNSLLEGFVQDSWKLRSNVTLELGVRVSSASSWKLDVLRYGHAPDVAASQRPRQGWGQLRSRSMGPRAATHALPAGVHWARRRELSCGQPAGAESADRRTPTGGGDRRPGAWDGRRLQRSRNPG